MPAVEALRSRLRAADPAERAAAAMEAGDEAAEALAADLRLALEDGDPAVRRAAARALGAVHAFRGRSEEAEVRSAVAALVVALHDPQSAVRSMATAALGIMQAPAVAADLVPMLHDPACAELAEEALVNLGPLALPAAGALEVVAQQVGEGAESAVRVLRELGPGALPSLGRLLDGPSAGRVLGVLPPLGPWAAPLVPQVLRHALGSDETAVPAARVIGAVGAEEAVVVLDRGSVAARVALLGALETPEVAVRALFDEEPVVRREALVALARTPGASAAFAAEISLLASDPDPETAATAAALLARFG